jgi:hypothetical protein
MKAKLAVKPSLLRTATTTVASDTDIPFLQVLLYITEGGIFYTASSSFQANIY